MTFTLVILFLALFAHPEVSGDILECYSCEDQDCNSIDTMQIVQCYPITTTTRKPTTVSSTTKDTTPPPPDSTTGYYSTTAAFSTTDSTTAVITTTGTTTDGSTTIDSTTDDTTATDSTSEDTTPTVKSTTEDTTSPSPVSAFLLSNYRAISRTRRATAPDGTSYACYTVLYKDNGSRTKKGCIEVPVNDSACEVINQQLGVESEKCDTCLQSKCNSSNTTKISILTIAILISIRFLI